MNLIGLAELAELYKVSKNTANTWARRHDWPSPVANLKMGPVWDKDVVLAHKPLIPDEYATVWDEPRRMMIKIKPPHCGKCDMAMSPVAGSLRTWGDSCNDVIFGYDAICECGELKYPCIDYALDIAPKEDA